MAEAERRQIEADIALSRDAGHDKVPVTIATLELMLSEIDKGVARVAKAIDKRRQ